MKPETKKLITAILSVIPFLAGWCIGSILGLSTEMQLVLAFMFWAMYTFSTEYVPPFVAGFLMLTALSIARVAPTSTIFAGFTSTATWFIFSGLIFGLAWERTGLARRVAISILARSKLSFKSLLLMIFIATMIVGCVIPSDMGKVAILTPIIIATLTLLGEKPCSLLSVALLMGMIAALDFSDMILTAHTSSPIVAEFYRQATGQSISWALWTYLTWPIGVLYTIVGFILCLVIFRRASIGTDKTVDFKQELKKLGPMSLNEKKLAILSLFVIAAWATDFIHGIDAVWIGLIFVFIACLPKIGVLSFKDLREANYPLILYVGIMVSMGSVIRAVKLDTFIADRLAYLIKGQNLLIASYLVILAIFLIGIPCTPPAVVSALSVPISKLALAMGMNPFFWLLYVWLGSLMSIFPFEFPPYLFVVGTGWLDTKSFIKFMAIRTAILLAIAPPLYLGYLSMIGYV